MSKRLKKFLTIIVGIIVSFGACFLCFWGINSWVEAKNAKIINAVYLIVTDGRGGEYKMGDGELFYLELEYEREESPLGPWEINALDIDWTAYNGETGKPYEYIKMERCFDDRTVDLATPGRYYLHQKYEIGLSFDIKVTVKENRTLPDIELLPDEKCIEVVDGYENGQKFVYKYDGACPLPKIKISQGGKEIFVSSLKKVTYHSIELSVWNGEEFILSNQYWACDIGLYYLNMTISRKALPEGYQTAFLDIQLELIIEIIE